MNEEQVKFASKHFTVGIYVFCTKCKTMVYTSPDMIDFSQKNSSMDSHLEDKHGIGDKK